MPNCSNCGYAARDGAKFCEACGNALIETDQHKSDVIAPAIPIAVKSGALNLMLLSVEAHVQEQAVKAISDICGYSIDDARRICSSAPIVIARQLSETQAAYIASMLAREGMEITVYDSEGYRELCADTPKELPKQLSARNRIESHLIRPWNIPYMFTGDKPPVFRCK